MKRYRLQQMQNELSFVNCMKCCLRLLSLREILCSHIIISYRIIQGVVFKELHHLPSDQIVFIMINEVKLVQAAILSNSLFHSCFSLLFSENFFFSLNTTPVYPTSASNLASSVSWPLVKMAGDWLIGHFAPDWRTPAIERTATKQVLCAKSQFISL